MGNQSSTQNHIDMGDIATNYTYDMKLTDVRFGEIKLLKNKNTGERIFQKDFTSNAAKEFEEYISRIKKRLPLLHPNILKVLGYNSKKEDLFCADFFKISLFFESFETDLEREIYKRNSTKDYFSETELRCLLDSIISACSFLQKNQIAHGDIRPFNIFITKNKEYKLCDSSLFHSAYNPSYFGLLDGLEAKTHYPSPQVFKNYRDKKGKSSDFDSYKNDIYGLGMSVLMAAQLEKIDNAYDFDRKTVDQNVVDTALERLKGRYSEGLIGSLRILLSPEEAQRPDFIELDDEIKHYRPDIRARANLERTLEAQRRQTPTETPLKAGLTTPAPSNPTPTNHYYIDDELDKRVRKAVEKSETMINKSPSRYKNEILDNCIQTYLKKDPLPGEKPLLYTISPHLTMQTRLAPTLKVYSQDQGRLSASQYNVADVSQNLYNNADPNNQAYYAQEPIGQDVRSQGYQATANYGDRSNEGLVNYGATNQSGTYDKYGLGLSAGPSANEGYASQNYSGLKNSGLQKSGAQQAQYMY